MFDDTSTDAAATSTRINGHPPLLSSALDQVEVAPAAKAAKAVRAAKSPFQSFQAKFSKSPAKPARTTSSPGAGGDSMRMKVPRSGPMMVDLAHPDDAHGTSVAADTLSDFTAPSTTHSAAVSSGNGPRAAQITAGPPTSASDRPSSSPTPPPKPVRKLFPSSRPVVAQRSICFSTESVATALDVTPDGEIVVVGFTDGSVRLYEMDSSVPSDRHGYLLGHLDEQSSQRSDNVHMRVKISPDGRYVFAGDRQRRRVVMSINLDHYRNEKEGDDEDFQQFQKHFHGNSKLRGFADVTTYVPPTDSSVKEQQENTRKRSAYYILTGLGVGNLNLWRFVEQYQQEPIWEHLQNFGAGGNTAVMAAFLPSSESPGVLAIAAVCRDKNLRVWPMEYTRTSSAEESNDDSATETEDTSFLGGVHSVSSHFNIQNTSDIVAIHGQYGYGISLMGEAYRICFPDSSILNSSCERLPRQVFELEKLGGGGISKSRRSNVMLESLAASDDGKTVVVVSSEGIFYYSNKLPEVGSDEEAHLRIIGKNASENTLFKAPMKVYTPRIKTKDTTVKSEAMMAVVTNPSDEDSEEEGGFINVDPTEAFAARWMVPSRGQDCWVCGVRNASHWVGPPESKAKEPSRAQLEAQQRERTRAQRRQYRLTKRALTAASSQQTSSNSRDAETPVAATPKTTPRSSARKVAKSKENAQFSAVVASSPGIVQVSGQKRRMSQNSGAGDDEDEDCTGSDDNTPSIASLMSELEHFKKRNAEIKTEWQRRLLGERQLRRKWKQREEEFLDQLNDSLTKLDTAEVEVDRLRVLLRDAEKRFAFEKARVEQETSVKARYEQMCEQMNDKMALIADQKRLLEQTTRSLLTEVDRNVHALKNAVILEKTECVVCKDQQAVTAIVPCGHLCFCEQDAETYRRNCTTQYPTCPICQQEIISLLRIYT